MPDDNQADDGRRDDTGDDDMSTIYGTIHSVERTGSSVNGNPAYLVTIDRADGSGLDIRRTMSDTMWAYCATDPRYRRAQLSFTLTRAGRIRYAETVEIYACQHLGDNHSGDLVKVHSGDRTFNYCGYHASKV